MPVNDDGPRSEELPKTASNGTCAHDMPTTLRDLLGPGAICLSCVVDDCIAQVRQIQADLKQRDGIFGSKTKTDFKHKDYTKKWGKAKLRCYNDTQVLKMLRTDFPQQAQEWGVSRALEKWEQALDEVARVPGYKYVRDKPMKPEKEEKSVKPRNPKRDSVSNVEVGTGSPLRPQGIGDLLEQDPEWTVVTRKCKTKKKRRMVDLTEAVESMSEELSSTRISDAAAVDADVSQEMDVVTKRLEQRSAMGSWDIFDAIPGIEFTPTEESDDYVAPHNRPPTPPTPPTPSFPPPLARPSINQPLRSALKGSRPEPVTSRATFADRVTILTSSDGPAIEGSHNKHTVARFAHRRNSLLRGSRNYREGIWSSPAGSEKYDTSFLRKSWFDYEKHIRTAKGDDAWEHAGSRPTYNSEVTEAMNKVRDRRLKESTNHGEKEILMIIPPIPIVDEVLEAKQNDVAFRAIVPDIEDTPAIGKLQINAAAPKPQLSPRRPAVSAGTKKGRKIQKTNSSKMTTTQRKRLRMQETQSTAKEPISPTGNGQKQLMLHPMLRHGHEEQKDGMACVTSTALTTMITLPGGEVVLREEPPVRPSRSSSRARHE